MSLVLTRSGLSVKVRVTDGLGQDRHCVISLDQMKVKATDGLGTG